MTKWLVAVDESPGEAVGRMEEGQELVGPAVN
jgi:hypothetical protein